AAVRFGYESKKGKQIVKTLEEEQYPQYFKTLEDSDIEQAELVEPTHQPNESKISDGTEVA
ncbi:unnamed protein product, partial [marine sediment metagenome]